MAESEQEGIIPETAGGGVIYRISDSKSEPEVLLIYRRGLWDLPKGKLEPKETIKECARREVSEEVGCSLPTIEDSLGETHHTFTRGNKQFDKTTHWYVMQVPEKEYSILRPQAVEHIEQVEWMSLSDAQNKVAFDNLKDLLDRFEQWFYE